MSETQPGKLNRRDLLTGAVTVAAKAIGGEVLSIPGGLATLNRLCQFGVRNDRFDLVNPYLIGLHPDSSIFDFGTGELRAHPRRLRLLKKTISAGIEPLAQYNPIHRVDPKVTKEYLAYYFDTLRRLEEEYRAVYTPRRINGKTVRCVPFGNEPDNTQYRDRQGVGFWLNNDLEEFFACARETYEVGHQLLDPAGEVFEMPVAGPWNNRNNPLFVSKIRKTWQPIPPDISLSQHIYGGIFDVLFVSNLNQLLPGIRREIGEINTAQDGGNTSLKVMLNALLPYVKLGMYDRVTFFQLPEFKSYGLVKVEEIGGKQRFVLNSRYPIVREFSQKLRSK